MTYFYRIAPWNIGKMTLLQWQDYLEQIPEITGIFQGKSTTGPGAELSTEEKKRLIKMAKMRGIKPPKRGL